MYTWIEYANRNEFMAANPGHRVVLNYYFRPELEGPWCLFFCPREVTR